MRVVMGKVRGEKEEKREERLVTEKKVVSRNVKGNKIREVTTDSKPSREGNCSDTQIKRRTGKIFTMKLTIILLFSFF